MSRLTEGLRSLVSRVLGGSGRRHGIADFSPQEDISPAAPDPQAPAITETPDVASPAERTSAPASSPVSGTGSASIRLIFTDGTVMPLPESSLEGRKAQYLARRVLEAGRGS
jgi:hypothetical protein